jgi:hypothetical protein
MTVGRRRLFGLGLRMWGGQERLLVSRQIVDERPAVPVTSHHEAGRHVLAEQRNSLGMQAHHLVRHYSHPQ